jgi:hypothetical protein
VEDDLNVGTLIGPTDEVELALEEAETLANCRCILSRCKSRHQAEDGNCGREAITNPAANHTEVTAKVYAPEVDEMDFICGSINNPLTKNSILRNFAPLLHLKVLRIHAYDLPFVAGLDLICEADTTAARIGQRLLAVSEGGNVEPDQLKDLSPGGEIKDENDKLHSRYSPPIPWLE